MKHFFNIINVILLIIGFVSGVIGIVAYINNTTIIMTSSLVIFLLVILAFTLFKINQIKTERKIIIEGINIGTFHTSNKCAKNNSSLKIDSIEKFFIINGKDSHSEQTFTGVCCKKTGELGVRLAYTTGTFEPISKMNIECYDLLNDPECKMNITYQLMDGEGLTKSLFIPFIKPIKYNEQFKMNVKKTSKNVMVFEKDYIYNRVQYSSGVNDKFYLYNKCILKFVDNVPNDVRCYKISKRKVKFIGLLPKIEIGNNYAVFEDYNSKPSIDEVRVYFFDRKE